MLIINTGNGKGKTTAAIGQVIRSLGRGWKVGMIQLFKGNEFYGEQKILKKLPGFSLWSYAPRHPYCFPETKPELVRRQCLQALKKLSSLPGKSYDLIVLEEFNIALREDYLSLKELLEVMALFDPKTVIMVTGRGAPGQLIRKADLVTEMKEIKHPFTRGINARKGLEF